MKRHLKAAASLRTIFFAIATAMVFTLCVVPFINLVAKVIFADGELSFQPFVDVLSMDSVALAVFNTLKVCISITFASLVVGVPLAWLFSRTNFPQARRFRSWLSLPFAIPPYVGAIAWIYLANPSTGLFNTLLGTLFGSSVFNIYSISGLIFVETSFLYTFVFLGTLSALDRMDSSLEEAARLSGASPWRVFKDITLPILRPSLTSGALLVFLAAVASFGVPALIGGPARIYLLTTQIYTLQRVGSMSGLIRAAALSIILMIAALLLLLAAHFITTRKKLQTVSGKTARPSEISLGRWRWPIFTLVVLFGCVVFVFPVGGIILSSLSHTQGALNLENFTFENWTRILFEVDETPRAIWNSLVTSAGAATLASIVALFVSYIQIKTAMRGRSAFDLLSSLPYATPGTVVALALIMSFSVSFLGVLPSLYNTLALILIAYFVKYLSFSIRTIGDGYRQIDDVLAEAARMSGANWTQVLVTIWIPLLMPSIVASWFLVFMPALSEMTMTLLLSGPGLETIGTLTFQMQEYSDASGGGASVLALIVIGTVIAINFTVKRVSKGKYGL